MENCEIVCKFPLCNKKFKNRRAFASHIFKHKITAQEYARLYNRKEIIECPICRKEHYCSVTDQQNNRNLCCSKKCSVIKAEKTKNDNGFYNQHEKFKKRAKDAIETKRKTNILSIASLKGHKTRHENGTYEKICKKQSETRKKNYNREKAVEAARKSVANRNYKKSKNFSKEEIEKHCWFASELLFDVDYLVKYSFSDCTNCKIVNVFDFVITFDNNKFYIQQDGQYWHGLDRPVDEIKKLLKKQDAAIIKKYEKDQKTNRYFLENNLNLIRFKESERVPYFVCGNKDQLTDFFKKLYKTKIADFLDDYFKKRIKELCSINKGNIEVPENIIITDSFSDVLEKLIISTIRAWNIEADARRPNITDQELADNRKKERTNNGIIRPRLIEALNKMFDLALQNKFSFQQDSVKTYQQDGKNLEEIIENEIVNLFEKNLSKEMQEKREKYKNFLKETLSKLNQSETRMNEIDIKMPNNESGEQAKNLK